MTTSTQIPYHNPDNLTPEQVGVKDGWRLALKEEVSEYGPDSPLNGKSECWAHERWDAGGFHGAWKCNGPGLTYRTREPLPPRWQQVADGFPDGLPLLPKAPDGMRWKYMGLGGRIKDGAKYAYFPSKLCDGWYVAIDNAIGQSDLHYAEAVQIKEEPDYQCPKYRARVKAAHRQGLRIQTKHHSQPEADSSKWLSVVRPRWIWSFQAYRIHPSDEAKLREEPLQSTEDELTECLKAWIRGEQLERFWMGQWGHCEIADLRHSGAVVRIKPPAPKKVPLDDYRVGEFIRNKISKVIMQISNVLPLTSKLEYQPSVVGEVGFDDIADHWDIYRNNQWQPCERVESSN